jgi:uncharacterized membrane protein HdeD (DUF308 family)
VKPSGETDGRKRRFSAALFAGVLALISAGVLVYSQTMSFVWDEGFHLVAAQLIDAGKIPYIDFCFPQTPLNAYFNAGLMRMFGQNWHVTHVAAALFVIGTMILMADLVHRRFPIPGWRLASALFVACTVGLDVVIMQFGTSAQAYGIGMFLVVAAFRCTIAGARKRQPWLCLIAGLLAGSAAGSTLLTAPAAPILLVWLWIYNRGGGRRIKATAFLVAAVIPFAPVFWLLAKAPRQTSFNVVQYQALFRRVNWGDVNAHDVDALSDWLASTQALIIGLLAIAGLLYLWKNRLRNRTRRAELNLVAWLSIGMGLYIATAHPTFGRYFVFMIPFTAVLAAVGLYSVGSRLAAPDRPFWPAAVAIGLITLSLGKALFDDRASEQWKDYQEIANKVKQVTPPHKLYFADELVYFLLHQIPPTGMEFSYSRKLQLPADQEQLYHIISNAEFKKQIAAGRFYTVENCKDDVIDEFKLDDLFPNRKDIGNCSVYWGEVNRGAPTGKK